ncbi:tetratricopeptide repeat protein [Paenibacillus sp. KS-LC4]|uniref:tetratricopeptide repeat protein n=1 Tax=Paenibacillus sp. KS-LC4 TaxID=2979727 RepID=UPI0030D4CDA7
MITNALRIRPAWFPKLEHAWQHRLEGSSSFIMVYGESGLGKKDTVRAWAEQVATNETIVASHGSQLTHGYFAAFAPFLDIVLPDAHRAVPELIHRHEQTLKRLFPFLPAAYFKYAKDLTNTATQDERTRFYHHEYQEKLLHGVYEFLLEYCQLQNRRFIVIVDQAEDVSSTVKTFLRIMMRRKRLSAYLHIILLGDRPLEQDLEAASTVVTMSRLARSEYADFLQMIPDLPKLAPKQVDQLFAMSDGNPVKLFCLLAGKAAGLELNNYLSFETGIDFYLNLKGEKFRSALLREYIEGHCSSDDPTMIRNYTTFHPEVRDRYHREHLVKLAQDEAGEWLLHPVHGLALTSQSEQLAALTPLSIKLQEIGLYDTWFEMFSSYYTSSHLRVLPDGDQPYNAVFIRMSFILYSLGLAKLSIPYLEFFYQQFPESLSIPMILYSQSMTYGRYQTPVNLPKAEQYALLNLEKIDSLFHDHPKYEYIKVFAENALAYIRARQGRLDEAIQLCTQGLDKMKRIYGSERYALHQSILVYNTGQIYEILGDFPKAFETYKQAIELDPNYGEYYNDMANLLKKFDHNEEALSYYEQAIQLCPPYYEAHINRADLYEKLGRSEAAEADYLRALELKTDAVPAYMGLGLLYYQEGKHQEALEMFNQAIYHQPEDAQAYNNRSLVYQELNQADAARADLDQALASNPRLSEALNNRAILAYQNEQYDACLQDLLQAIELQKSEEYYINLSMLYRKLGQLKEAFNQLQAAKEHFGSSEQLHTLMVEIEKELAS